jgi:hypothetical protein
VLGRENHDHVRRLAGISRDDVSLAVLDDAFGVVELEPEIEHVLDADQLESHAQRGRRRRRQLQSRSQRLTKHLAERRPCVDAACASRDATETPAAVPPMTTSAFLRLISLPARFDGYSSSPMSGSLFVRFLGAPIRRDLSVPGHQAAVK